MRRARPASPTPSASSDAASRVRAADRPSRRPRTARTAGFRTRAAGAAARRGRLRFRFRERPWRGVMAARRRAIAASASFARDSAARLTCRRRRRRGVREGEREVAFAFFVRRFAVAALSSIFRWPGSSRGACTFRAAGFVVRRGARRQEAAATRGSGSSGWSEPLPLGLGLSRRASAAAAFAAFRAGFFRVSARAFAASFAASARARSCRRLRLLRNVGALDGGVLLGDANGHRHRLALVLRAFIVSLRV